MKYETTEYFNETRKRSVRAIIQDNWIEFVIENPVHEEVQPDGQIRRWAKVAEAGGRYLRVILLEDGETVHNAFLIGDFR